MFRDTISILHDHWQGLREGNLPPFRSEISPREIPAVLDTLFILEHLSTGDTRVRIAGMTLCEMMGMEMRGLAPEVFFTDAAQAGFSDILQAVLDGPEIAELRLGARDRLGNEGLLRMVLLPLRSDFGDVSRIIGCVDRAPAGLKAPVRFDIFEADVRPLRRERTVGFAEAQAGFAPALRSIKGNGAGGAPRRSGYLKVVS